MTAEIQGVGFRVADGERDGGNGDVGIGPLAWNIGNRWRADGNQEGGERGIDSIADVDGDGGLSLEASPGSDGNGPAGAAAGQGEVGGIVGDQTRVRRSGGDVEAAGRLGECAA